jgi:hypothetical protein
MTLFKAPKNGPKLYSHGIQELFNSAEQLEKCPEPNISEEKAIEVGEIWDVMSQTVETKNTTGSKCSAVTLQSTFWGHSVTILVGWTIHPLLGLNITWSKRFWVVKF